MKKCATQSIKFLKLKRRLGLPRWQVIGVLESIWHLTLTDAPAGDLGRLSNEDIAAAIEWDGDEDKLIADLTDCGWLDPSNEHRLVVHNWEKHAPTYVKGIMAREGREWAKAGETKCGTKLPTKCGTKCGTKDQELSGQLPILSYPPETETETETESGEPEEAWTKCDEELSALASQPVTPLPLGPKVDGASVFASLTDDMLRSPPTVVGWFRRQLSAAQPVLPANHAALLLTVCCAMRATDRGIKKPVGSFVNLVRGRKWAAVSRYRAKAEAAIKEVLHQ